jgi:hypothetical protein
MGKYTERCSAGLEFFWICLHAIKMKPIYEYSVYYFLVAKHLLPRQNLENEKKGCSNRKQQIKIGNIVSTWANIQKGVPQGSILEPLLFNVFINYIFYIMWQTVECLRQIH